MKQLIAIFALMWFLPSISANIIKDERLISFEEGIPTFITAKNSKITISKAHYKDGSNSLLWSAQPNSSIIINKDLKYEDTPVGSSHLSSFTGWIYNENPSDEKLTFEFYEGDKKCSWFEYGLNFKGWRAIYIAYERDMNGKPCIGMDQIRVNAHGNLKGNIYFDMLLTSSKADKRHHTPDLQQPFVNEGITNHWQVMLEKSSIKPDKNLFSGDVTKEDIISAEKFDTRLRELIVKKTSVNQAKVDKLTKELTKYNITKNEDGSLVGLPLFYVYYAEAFQHVIPKWDRSLFAKRGQEYKDYFTLMSKIAMNYINTDDTNLQKQLADMFILMFDYAQDQGAAYGSGLGNASHYGYSFRGLFTSYFLMKDVLLKNDRLKEAYKTLQWYAQTNEVFIEPTVNGQDMDSFNTLAMAKICSVLMMDNTPEKFQYLKGYSRWVDTGCKPSPGLSGSFKVDGGAFHHVGHYPAYAVGGLGGATDMIYIFHQTPYAISELGHSTVKKVLSNLRFYCNQNHFPLAMSGRHPDGQGQLVPLQYGRMALAGTPDGKNEIDQDMGSAFLRLIQTNNENGVPEYVPSASTEEINKLKKRIEKRNIKAEEHPQGNIEMGYASISAHRRSNWLALAKGFSRYVWASEHYAKENFYGRYLSYGSLQILTAREGEIVTPKSSGWAEEGFNWARIPGTTAINLPVDKMRAAKNKSEMLLSDEIFSGGVSQKGNNGAFGIILHEHDRYDGSHRARKSYHFIDNKIVCLGSNIENDNKENQTETTLFQLAIFNDADKAYWENNKSSNMWVDHLGTAYYIPKNQVHKLNFEKNYAQQSKSNMGKKTVGDWVSLTMQHGFSPKEENYEYVVMPQTKLSTLKKEIKNYKVLEQSKNAHIVKDMKANLTSYVLFEANNKLPNGLIKEVDTPSLVLVQETKNKATISVANPDLAFYRGPSLEIRDKNGKRMMVNPYATPWKDNESMVSPVKLTIEGKWTTIDNKPNIHVNIKDNNTIIVVDCQHGLSYDIELTPNK